MISVAILTKNNEETLQATLESVKEFSEVILLDTGSNDNTLQIAGSFPNVKIYSSPFVGFGMLRNLAAKYASNNWIFALDSDEVLSEEVKKEIHALSMDPSVIYEFPFFNFYKGKKVKCCGWYPESHIRLYHKKTTSFKEYHVHEGIKVDALKVVKLTHPIYHTPYRSIGDFLAKMQHYTSLFAEQHKGKKPSSFFTAFIHGAAAFFKSYLLKRGIFFGEIGFLIATYNASTAFYKYLKLAEENSKL